MAQVTTAEIAAAEQAGRDAFHRGIKCAPCLDRVMCGTQPDALMAGDRKMGGGIPLLEAWTKGWTYENLKAPVPGVSTIDQDEWDGHLPGRDSLGRGGANPHKPTRAAKSGSLLRSIQDARLYRAGYTQGHEKAFITGYLDGWKTGNDEGGANAGN